MQQPLRIVNIMFSTSDRPFGTEKVAYKYVDMLMEQGHEVLFVHRHEYDLDHIQAHDETLSLYRMKKRHIPDLVRARRAVKRFRPDVIVVHNHFSRFRIIGWGIAPMIGVAHLGNFESLTRYEGAVAFRPDLVEQALDSGIRKERIGVVGNTSDFGPPLPVGTGFQKVPVIGAIGRLSAEKNYAVYLKALHQLKEQGVEFTAVLGGSGPQDEELRESARSLNLETHLMFPGFIDDIRGFFESIDIFCMPSVSEAFGVALLEAMAAGKPIAASRIASFNLILDGGACGMLFKPDSPSELAECLKEMLADPSAAQKMAAQSSKRYMIKYSESVIGEELNQFIYRIAGKGG